MRVIPFSGFQDQGLYTLPSQGAGLISGNEFGQLDQRSDPNARCRVCYGLHRLLRN